jgi:hypothetical protein
MTRIHRLGNLLWELLLTWVTGVPDVRKARRMERHR